MDPLTHDIRQITPTDPAVRPLIETHLELMRASSPACSVHAMAAEDMAEAGMRFFAAFNGAEAVAIGALKALSGTGGEIKSMHVREGWRGNGLADQMLRHLIAVARASGMKRLSLETGSQRVFTAARAFYLRHGFEMCPPFEGYAEDPASVFMTRAI